MTNNFWQGQHIRLRGIEPEDYTFFHEWNLETGTQTSLDQVWYPGSLQRQKEWALEKSRQDGTDDSFFFVIETLDGTKVGSITANCISRVNGTFKYGIAIIQEARQKGYATEAIQIVLRYYFNELGYQKVNVEVYEFNTASISLHERLHFQKEGQLRSSKYHDGKYWDILLFGLTKDEFYKTSMV